MSTMNKTNVDWENYKQQNAGLDEELAQHTKNGYVGGALSGGRRRGRESDSSCSVECGIR
jgi:hypothetical protein